MCVTLCASVRHTGGFPFAKTSSWFNWHPQPCGSSCKCQNRATLRGHASKGLPWRGIANVYRLKRENLGDKSQTLQHAQNTSLFHWDFWKLPPSFLGQKHRLHSPAWRLDSSRPFFAPLDPKNCARHTATIQEAGSCLRKETERLCVSKDIKSGRLFEDRDYLEEAKRKAIAWEGA